LIEHAERLQGDRGMHARSEVRAGDQWLPTSNRGGIASGRMLLERVLMVESSGGRTMVGCSPQGGRCRCHGPAPPRRTCKRRSPAAAGGRPATGRCAGYQGCC
jgi:hypothetical protein